MTYTCSEHVKYSLKLLITPHVMSIDDAGGKTCQFCEKKAEYKLIEHL